MPKSKRQKTWHHNHNQYHYNNSTSTSANGSGDLTYEEIWDDSALLRSWNDAVREYEFYHSIHARGEDVDEVLRQAELAESQSQSPSRENAKATATGAADVSRTVNDTAEVPSNHKEEEEEEGEISESTIPARPHSQPQLDALSEDITMNAEMSLDLKRINGDMDYDSPVRRQTPGQPQREQEKVHRREDASTTIVMEILGNGETSSTGTEKAKVVKDVETVKDQSGQDQDQTLENIKMAYYWAGYYSGLYDGQKQMGGQR